MGRSLQHLISNGFRTLQGRNPQGAPRKSTRNPLTTNLNHFYPVAGAAGNSSTEYGYIQNLHNEKIDTKIQLS